MPRPMYEVVTIGRYSDGSPVRACRASVAALDVQGRALGYPLTVLQGEMHEGGASAGTHTKLRCVDLAAFEATKKVRAGRYKAGWAAYRRPELPGVWGEHVHQGLLIKGEPDTAHTADLLALQLKGYRQNPPRDGLGPWPFGVDHAPVPTPRVEFDWQGYVEGRYDKQGNLISRARQRRLNALRHNADITRTVRRLKAARRKAQNPKVRNRLAQWVRELLGMKIKPKVDIDLHHREG